MNQNRTSRRRRVNRIICWLCVSLAVASFVAISSPVGSQSSSDPTISAANKSLQLTAIASPPYTKIYSSGILALGADQTLQLTIANNNNVSNSGVPTFPASVESCTVVARFLDSNGNAVKEQQQTLQPGQNFSMSISGQQTVQARADVSPTTVNGFAGEIADQCVVSTEILNSSSEPVLFPPLASSIVPQASGPCLDRCREDCELYDCSDTHGCFFCKDACKQKCPGECP